MQNLEAFGRKLGERGLRWVVLGLAFCLSFCTEPEPLIGPPSPRSMEIVEGSLTYELVWSLDGVERLEQGGWRVETDQGYTVEIKRGYLVSYTVDLVDCARLSSTQGSVWQMWLPKAWAGHDDEPSPAAVAPSRVEAIHALEDVRIPSLMPGSVRYCLGHYLVGRADDETLDLPRDVDLNRTSLWVEGSWRISGEEEVHTFVVETALAAGVLEDLLEQQEGTAQEEAKAIEVDTGRSAVNVWVVRQPGRGFQGIDFAGVAARNLERSLLQNISETTHFIAKELQE